MNFSEIITEYNDRYRNDESVFFQSLENFEEALLYAGLAHDIRGKRLPHMNRLRYDALARGLRAMTLNRERLENQNDFHSLHHTLIEILTFPKVDHLGDVFYYDTAYRIGAYLNIFPEHIYLHADTSEGAVALGIDVRNREFIDIADLPIALTSIDSTLEPRHYEDILCIYDDELNFAFRL